LSRRVYTFAPRSSSAGRRASGLPAQVALLGVLWGASVMLQRMAVAEVPPAPLVALRLLAALLACLPFSVRLARAVARRPGLTREFLLVGALNPVLSALCTALALQHASSGVVAVLQTLSPISSAALAAAVFKEEQALGRQRVVALLVALGGVALLVLTGSSGLAGGVAGDVRGLLFAVCAPVAVSLATIVVRRRLGGTDPRVVASGQITAACLLSLPLAFLIGPPPGGLVEVSPRAWLAIVLSGAVGLSAAFVLFVRMIGRYGPTAALLATYVMPVVATLLGVLVLGETLTPPMLAGSALVLAGVLLFTRS
jgi:drug/metabolite transporter (DMT)-like permease